ncbi:hypothetical protein [Dysgonomonas sp. 25]|uniref:hypothetical protein n=1 Tax=Dysgonomonas sp. 25 TaxID=2302933 RepID=UPI0013D80800|nr:hypothetical protein [Dysgonomonas sp. 25]NDV69791.1 hypothetical protein [Dysgonomonas sp. 25]
MRSIPYFIQLTNRIDGSTRNEAMAFWFVLGNAKMNEGKLLKEARQYKTTAMPICQKFLFGKFFGRIERNVVINCLTKRRKIKL